ncbi:MAG: hypothetical protein RBS73_06505 [Prolixibacteraceae bacterium]|jgi:hypothetical protein|nr:hypothetical protein [Prolixibacteraceae bacterium]
MFFTGFSSPFISIFLAVVLPWLIVVFGKEAGLQIVPRLVVSVDSKQDTPEKTSVPAVSSFSKTEKIPADKAFACFYEAGKEYFFFQKETDKYLRPGNDACLGMQAPRLAGPRAPPQMFAI